MRITLLLIISTFYIQQSYAQLRTVQFEQLDSLQNLEERTVAIFIHTDWCKYCEAMNNTTLKNEDVVSTLNNKFYFIDFNAEEKRDITISGSVFKFKSTGNNTGVHKLAEQLGTMDKEISYPTMCFINKNNEIIFQYNQYLSASDFLAILKKLMK